MFPPGDTIGRPWRRAALVLGVLAAFCALLPAGAAAQPRCPKLQALPFERVGADDRMDWLARGFAELMELVLGRACLEGIEPANALPETKLLRTGDPAPSAVVVRPGARAPDFVLTGSWFVDGPEIVVEALLLRFADERWMAVANWRGPVAEVLTAPAKMARTHLEQLGLPHDTSTLVELEREVPQGLPAAAVFFRGLAAKDAGDHAMALERLLECVAAEPGFVRARREALRAMLILGREEQATAFALESARRLEGSDPAHSLEFLWEASRLSPGTEASSAIDILERLDRLALQHEAATGDAAALRRRILSQIAVLADEPAERTGPELLARASDRWRIWTAEIDGDIERRVRQKGVQWVQRESRWVAEAIPEPSVAMWRVRALLDLARRHARAGRIEEAYERYRQIHAEYAFLEQTGRFGVDSHFYWLSGIRLEAHFMMLRHLKESGRLVRDRTLHPRIFELRPGESFERDFGDPAPDARARVWSRRTDGGHEYFDFAAPAGLQVDRVRVETRVPGSAWLDVDLPDPQGWPPQFSFSRRIDKRRLPRGESVKTYDLPEGTVFFSVSVLWGPRWVRSFGDALAARRARSAGGPEIVWMRITFETSTGASPPAAPGGRDKNADRKIFEHYAGKWGWEEGKVVRAHENLRVDSGSPEATGKTWLSFELDGNLLLAGVDGVRGPALPRQINTPEPESSPRLVGTHEGNYALLWQHGPRGGKRETWIASTEDFTRWGAPRRVMSAATRAEGRSGRNEDALGPIAPVPGGYLMLLGGGETRSSPDLARWGPARPTIAADGPWKALARTDNGRIWAVLTREEDREVPAGERPNPVLGFYRTADGRTFEKRTAVLVSVSRDGSSWTEPNRVDQGAEPTGLWAFPVGQDRIAVVAGYGSLDLRVHVVGDEGGVRPVAAALRLPMGGPEAAFFVREGKVWCARVVHDFLTQESVVLFSGSLALFRAIEAAGP